MRRATPVSLGLVVAALLAGCGGGDSKGATTTAAQQPTVTTPAVPPLTRIDAIREVQSAVSQEAFKRDFSYAAADISVGCAPLDPANGEPRFACRFSSPKNACKGRANVARAADGSNTTSGLTIKCTGPPNIGPDTSQPSG
jgi:hypothetical protein